MIKQHIILSPPSGVVPINPPPHTEKTLPDQDWERSVEFLLILTARLLPVSFFAHPPITEGKRKKKKEEEEEEEKIGVKVEEHFNL